MKKARLIFLASLLVMAMAAFKGNPYVKNKVRSYEPERPSTLVDTVVNQ